MSIHETTQTRQRLADLSLLHGLSIPPFVPPRWLRSGHAQTSMVPLLPAGRGEIGERVTIPIDGGTLAGRLHHAQRSAPGSAPLRAKGCVLVLHGIAGSADEPFVMRTARLAALRGLDALRLSMRGAGESIECGPPPLYHAGLTSDVRAALLFLAERYERVHAIGFSLGGQLVLRTLGEWGCEVPAAIASATAISPPVDLAACARFSDSLEATLYRVYIVRALKARFASAMRTFPADFAPRFSARAVRRARTIRDYDGAVVVPLFGYRDADDYYARASAGAVIDRIAVPTLILHAADDPLVWVEPVAAVAARRLPNLRVIVTDQGGHVSFFARDRRGGDETRFWAEERAIDFARALTP